MQAIDRLLSHNLNFNIPIPNQAVIYTISLSMKEFLQVLKLACSEKSIKIENILIIGGAVPWILGSEYCTALLENLVPGSTSSLSRRELMSIDLPPNDVDIRFIIPPESKEHIQWLKNRVVQYLCNKLPAVDYSQTELEDMITTMGNVFQEFQQTTLWDQENQQIDIDYFIFGINDLSQSKYEVSLVSLLRRPYLFSMQNLCLDISGFLSEKTSGEAICPMSLSVPHSFRDAAQAILEKITRIFHIPIPETVDKKGWICYCSLLTKLTHCPEGSSLAILRAATAAYCLKESKDPQKGSNSPLNILIGFLEWSVRKHHDSKAEDAIALAFNICSTAEGAWSQSDLSLLWQTLAAKFPAPAKSLLPPHLFSRAMHNPDFSFDVLSAILEIQAFFYLCSSQAANSNDFTAYLITNDGKPAVQWVDKNRGLLLPFDPLQAFRIVDEKLAELSSQGKLSSVKELEHLWSAFSIPTNPHDERVPPFVRDKAVLKVDYASLDMLAIQLMEHEESFGRRIGYRLFVLLQKLHPESRRRSLLVRHVPDMVALERSREVKVKCLQEVSKEFFGSAPTEISLLLQRALEALIEYICQPNVKDEQILLHWTLGLARIQDHSLYGDVFFFWKRYQFLINGKNDELSEPLIKALLPANILMAGQLLLRSVYSIETKLPLYFALFSAHNQKKKCSQSGLNVEMLFQLTMQLFPCIPEALIDKDRLAVIIRLLVEEFLLQKQPVHVHALLLAEEKKRVLGNPEAAKFWAALCHLIQNDPAKGIIPALEIFQEALNYGIWNACKPRKLMLQIISGLYALGDICRWHQADLLVDELCDDPTTSEEIRTAAIRLLIEKKERISLKGSPVYHKIKDLFHPAERLETLRLSLQARIVNKNAQEAILILKELAKVKPLSESFRKDLLSVCSMIDQTWVANSSIDSKACHDFLRILFHPSTLNMFSRAEFFPINSAVRLCYYLQITEEELLGPIVFNLVLFSRKAPKGVLLSDNRMLLAALLSKTVQSTNAELLKQLSDHSDHVLALLQEGNYLDSLYTFVMNCREHGIQLDETGKFFEKLMDGLQKTLEYDEVSIVVKTQTFLKTFLIENVSLSVLIACLKEKMMNALLRHHQFAAASEWVQIIGKEAFLSSLSASVLLAWIPQLVGGKQFDAAAELLKAAFKYSNETRNACARLWMLFPEEMYLHYPQIGSKFCLQASKEMTEELKPVVQKILFSFLKLDADLTQVESACSLLERYAVPHPHSWRMIFVKIEEQKGKEIKVKQRLLPLLTKIAEPCALLLPDPESRRSCWLSALRCFKPSPNEVLGEVWKRILENGSDFLQIFPANDPSIVGEAFSHLLEVWIASLEKPNDDPDLLKRLISALHTLSPILDDPKADVWRQKILLQLLRGGSHSTQSGVLVGACELFESLLSEIECFQIIVEPLARKIEVTRVLKKLLSMVQAIIQKNPDEQSFLRKRLAQIIKKAGEVLDEESFLSILNHLLTLDLFFIDGEYVFLAEIMSFFMRKFEEVDPRDQKLDAQISLLLTKFLIKIEALLILSEEANSEFPLDLFLQYSHICEHPALPYFVDTVEQKTAFDKIPKMIELQKYYFKEKTQEIMINYIINGFPYHKVDNESKKIFFSYGIHVLVTILVVTKNTPKFFEKFEEFLENYGIYLSQTNWSSKSPKKNRNKAKQEFHLQHFVLMNILDKAAALREMIDQTPNMPTKDDLEINRCYERVIHYFRCSIIEILESITTATIPINKKSMIDVIDRIVKDPLFLNEHCQTAHFKLLTIIFERFKEKRLYSDYPKENIFHVLLFQYVFDNFEIKPPSLILGGMTDVQNWAIESKQPLCVYRWIRILELNQQSFYADNPTELVTVYQKAIEEVLKNPFYKISWFHQKDPDHVFNLIYGEHSPLKILRKNQSDALKQSTLFFPSQSDIAFELERFKNREISAQQTENDVYLCEALIESFLGFTHFMPGQEKIGQDCYREIWRNLFVAYVNILNKTWDDLSTEEGYVRLIKLLQELIQKGAYAKNTVDQQNKSDLSSNFCVLKAIFEDIPRLNEGSGAEEFYEIIPQIASIIEVVDHAHLMLEEESKCPAFISSKAKQFIGLLKNSPVLDFVPIDVILDFIFKAMVPTFLSHLLKSIFANTACSKEVQIQIFEQIDQQIMFKLLRSENIWGQKLYNKLLRISQEGKAFGKRYTMLFDDGRLATPSGS